MRKILEQKETDKKALAKSRHPIAHMLVESRSWVKAIGTFYRGFLDNMDDGYRVHPNINLHGTISGRLSCTKPNLMALPKGNSIYRVRDLIIAPPGYLLMSHDLNQVELRLMAHYTKDPFLVNAYAGKKDIHAETASELGIPRDAAKRINFGVVYGIGAPSLSDELGIPLSQAREYLRRYHKLIPGVRRLYGTAQHIAERDHKIPMWTGRLRHYRKEDATHKALSNLIQGGVAEMMRVIITRLYGMMKGTRAYQVLQIHDEILFEIPVADAAKWAAAIKTVMEDFNFDVPMVADGKVGLSWGAKNMRAIRYKDGCAVIPDVGQ